MLCLQYAFFTKVAGFVNFNPIIIKIYIDNPESQIWPPLMANLLSLWPNRICLSESLDILLPSDRYMIVKLCDFYFKVFCLFLFFFTLLFILFVYVWIYFLPDLFLDRWNNSKCTFKKVNRHRRSYFHYFDQKTKRPKMEWIGH